MKILIGNTSQIKEDDNKTVNDFKNFYFNPWGFSKKKIKIQVEELIKKINVSREKDIIYLQFQNLFYGNRVKFVISIISEKFPNINILNN